MSNLKSEIDEKTYLAGIPLSEATFKFGNPQIIEKYASGINKNPTKSIKQSDTNTLMGVLSAATQTIQDLHNQQSKQKYILESLYKSILLLIKNGNLIPYAYQSPRNLSDLPKRIPIDIILSGQLNWNNSELIYKNFEFTGIRLINAPKEILEIKSEINSVNNNSISEISDNSKNNQNNKSPQKKIEELAPDQFIDEKLAAEYLGISPRTLQGYRIKGGGPEFHKISHKVVRYKIAELIKWTENKKKKNTSEK